MGGPPKPSGTPVPRPALLAAGVLCLLAPIEAALALREPWFTEAAFWAHLAVVRGTILLSAVLAGALALLPRLRRWAGEGLDALPGAGPRAERAWLAAAGSGVFALFLFLKFCQYRGFQLPQDSTATGNLLFNILHHRSFASSVHGVESFFAVHFMPVLALLSPLLLLSKSLIPVLVFQTLLVASMPLAAYRLAREKTGSALAGACALWLLFTSQYLFGLASASLYAGLYLSLFLFWGLTLAETGRPRLAALAFLLAAATIEQACVAFAGLGAYLVLRLGPRSPRAWRLGGGLVLAASVLFLAEMRLRSSFPDAAAFRGWETYRHLREGALPPLLPTLRAPAEMLLSTGLLALLQPSALIPWAVNYLPGFLARPGDLYHEGTVQYTGYFIGPLWWAGCLGLARAHAWLARRGRAPWLAVFALGAGALNLWLGPQVLLSSWNWNVFLEGPGLVASVPPDAPVWAYQFASPRLSCRAFIKSLPRDAERDFEAGLFVPDYILIDRTWLQASAPAWRERLLTFMGREGYAKAAERWQLVLLKHPGAPLSPRGGRPPPLTLPEPEPARAAAFAASLERHDDLGPSVALLRGFAERGDALARYNMGLLHHAGLGVARDDREAARWWALAARQGHAPAFANLGIEAGSRRAWEEAASWFAAGARLGDADSRHNLALCRLKGLGVPEDRGEALRLLGLAAASGHQRSRELLERLRAGGP